jgi:hypothetical protein
VPARLLVQTSTHPPRAARAGLKVASASLARAVLFITFEYNDPAEFERADDLLIRRPNA